MTLMSLSMQVQPWRYCNNFSRILRPSSPDHPPPLRTRCTPCKFKCVAVVRNPAFATRTAKELQDSYGCQGLSFVDVGGTPVADLKLENGSKARLVLPTAQIISYKAHMWHGGEEELLHTVRTGTGKVAYESLRGGINLRFFYSRDPLSSTSPASTEWRVEAVRCQPSNYAQITLSTSSNAEVGIEDASQVCLQIRYVVTLTDESLSSAVIVTNAGAPAVDFKGSIVSHLAVSSIRGAFALGLTGCNYLSTPTQQVEELSDTTNFFPPIWRSETNASPHLPSTSPASLSERTISVRELDPGRWVVEKEDYAQMPGGEARLYPSSPSSLTILDRGFRRSLIVERVGFEEFWLSNPGPGSKLQDWDDFICLGPTQNSQSVVLLEKEEWRAAQILSNPGHG